MSLSWGNKIMDISIYLLDIPKKKFRRFKIHNTGSTGLGWESIKILPTAEKPKNCRDHSRVFIDTENIQYVS